MTFLPRRSIQAFTVRHTHAGVADRFFTWSFHDDEKKIVRDAYAPRRVLPDYPLKTLFPRFSAVSVL